MGFVIAFWVCVIIYNVFFNDKRSSPEGDITQNRWSYALVGYLVVFLCLVVLVKTWVFACALFFPYVFAIAVIPVLARTFGFYKAGYYAGRLAFIRFYRNPHSYGLLTSYQAIAKLDKNKRKKALLWLKDKYRHRTSKIFSGDMVMMSIIEADIKRSGDTQYLAQQLKLLKGLSTYSIPGSVSVFAFKLAVSQALTQKSWREILNVAEQWDTQANNRLAKFVINHYRHYDHDLPSVSWLSYNISWLFVIRYRELSNLKNLIPIKSSETEDDFNLDGGSVETLWRILKRGASPDAHLVEKIKLQLLCDSQKSIWSQRANELNVWDSTQALLEIEGSVERVFVNPKSNAFGSDEKKDKDEIQFNKLRYITRDIERLIERTKERQNAPTTFEHFSLWIQLWAAIQYFHGDEENFSAVIVMIHEQAWSWIAHLWNDKKEHCLVHYIASILSPLASENGLHDFNKTLVGILSGKTK